MWQIAQMRIIFLRFIHLNKSGPTRTLNLWTRMFRICQLIQVVLINKLVIEGFPFEVMHMLDWTSVFRFFTSELSVKRINFCNHLGILLHLIYSSNWSGIPKSTKKSLNFWYCFVMIVGFFDLPDLCQFTNNQCGDYNHIFYLSNSIFDLSYRMLACAHSARVKPLFV